jgi:excisionase family DNA binding protein
VQIRELKLRAVGIVDNLEEGRLLTAEEAAHHLGYSIGTLYNKVSRKEIPYVRLGNRTLRFRREALDAWMTDHPAEDTASSSEGAAA